MSFCPERIAEGKAMTELFELPQIVSARTDAGTERASSSCSGMLTDRSWCSTPEEAELAKLFTNTWRYIKFAAANQLFMMANDHGLDFERIRHAADRRTTRGPPTCRPRASPPGRACSRTPCSWRRSTTTTSPSVTPAMMVNEGLPLYVVTGSSSGTTCRR